MRIIKKLLLFLVALVVLLLVVALFIPKTYTVSHTTKINRPQKEVFEYAKMLKNQKDWSYWMLLDPNSKVTYNGEDGTVGAKQSWDGNDDVGAGTQTITKISEDRVDIDLEFIRPFAGKAKAAHFVTAVDANSCNFTEEYYGEEPYPMNLMSVIGKKVIGDAFAENGKNLKKVLEK
jgi:hypothetical protein